MTLGKALGRTIRPPLVRTTFQLAADISPRDGQSPHSVWRGCIETVLGWVQSRFPEHLPAEALVGQSFELEIPGQDVRCVAINDPMVWSLRFTHPDLPQPDRSAVPGRTWRVEFTLGAVAERVRFGARVVCASLPYTTQHAALTRPRVVLELAKRFTLRDVRPLDLEPWHLRSESDLAEFRAFLIDDRRILPAYLITEVAATDRRMIDCSVLASRVLGMAHVVEMPGRLGYRWTDIVGKTWSAFSGAVRTYRPGLDFEEDDPRQHPLALAATIYGFSHHGLTGDDAFIAFLVDQAHAHAATMRVDWGSCLFYADAARRTTALALETAREGADWRALYEQEIAALSRKIVELEEEAEEYNNDAIAAGRERDQHIDQNRRLRGHNDALRAALRGKGQPIDESIPIPDGLDELPEWVDTHLPGRLVLHARALRGIKDACYEEPTLIYKALLLLANEYRDMRDGDESAKMQFEQNLSELGLRFGGSITRERAGEQGDTYFVRFPTQTDDPRFLEFHVRKGASKDARYCLAIYFFWDEETRQVVVGWLPSHLETRAT